MCVCVLGTCYHNYKGLILVWSLRHEPVLWGGWTRTVGRMVSALVQLTIHLGVRVWWWPAGVVASVAACVPIVSRYNERCGVSHTTGQRRNSLFTLCVLT